MKRNKIRILILLTTAIMITSTVTYGKTITNETDNINIKSYTEKTFTTSSDDDTLWRLDTDSWHDAWYYGDGTAGDHEEYLTVGQRITNGWPFYMDWTVYRSVVYFSTSSIPDDVAVVEAKLKLYGAGDRSEDDFNIVIQRGNPPHMFPNRPPRDNDYGKSLYTGNGGQMNSADFKVDNWNTISLSPSWVSKDGWTNLILRSSKDIAGVENTRQEYVFFYTSEGSSNKPQLYVKYTQRPTATMNIDPADGITKEGGHIVEINFEGEGTDQDGTIVAYKWESNLDGIISTKKSFEKYATDLSTGRHTISFSVQDDQGAWSTPITQEINVQDINYEPTIVFFDLDDELMGYNPDINAGMPIYFAACGQDANGGGLSLHFHWDDGTPDTVTEFDNTKCAQPMHRFKDDGHHKIKCWAEDPGGLISDKITWDLYVGPKTKNILLQKTSILSYFPLLELILSELQLL
jgi:hypothetical protein